MGPTNIEFHDFFSPCTFQEPANSKISSSRSARSALAAVTLQVQQADDLHPQDWWRRGRTRDSASIFWVSNIAVASDGEEIVHVLFDGLNMIKHD